MTLAKKIADRIDFLKRHQEKDLDIEGLNSYLTDFKVKLDSAIGHLENLKDQWYELDEWVSDSFSPKVNAALDDDELKHLLKEAENEE